MKDARVLNLAKVLVRYSLQVKPEQVVEVAGSPQAEPLIVAVYEELLRSGAFPVVHMSPSSLAEILFKAGKPHHFDKITPYQRATARLVDASIRIYSSANTRALSNASPQKQARLSKAMKPLRDIIIKKPWVLTLYPTEAFAQDAEMSLSDFEDFVYKATFADSDRAIAKWKALAKRQDRLIEKLKGANKVQIIGPDTDLTLSVKGRTFINSAGTHNMPSGEVFTGPVEDSAQGYIRYDYPVCHAGREIDGIRIVFDKGRVVEASAEKNNQFLHSMLNIDPGAKRLGELGIGTNFGIQRFTRNILFDEKIGGSIHLALGSSYPETGGTNKSALHWDMIKDLRNGGALIVDGKVVQEDGKFKI